MAKWNEIWSKSFKFYIILKDQILRYSPFIWVFLIFIIILHPYLVILKILFGQYIYFVYLQCPRKRSKIYFGAHSLKALTTSHRQNGYTQRMRKNNHIQAFCAPVALIDCIVVNSYWMITIILWFCCIWTWMKGKMCKKESSYSKVHT